MARERNSSVDVEEVPADVEETTPEGTETAPKAKAEPKRGQLPDGVLTPVGFAKILGERGLQTNREGEVLKEVKPQMVYSYIKNAPKDDPFPLETVNDSIGASRQVVNIEAGVAWWERKNKRTSERSAN